MLLSEHYHPPIFFKYKTKIPPKQLYHLLVFSVPAVGVLGHPPSSFTPFSQSPIVDSPWSSRLPCCFHSWSHSQSDLSSDWIIIFIFQGLSQRAGSSFRSRISWWWVTFMFNPWFSCRNLFKALFKLQRLISQNW